MSSKASQEPRAITEAERQFLMEVCNDLYRLVDRLPLTDFEADLLDLMLPVIIERLQGSELQREGLLQTYGQVAELSLRAEVKRERQVMENE